MPLKFHNTPFSSVREHDTINQCCIIHRWLRSYEYILIHTSSLCFHFHTGALFKRVLMQRLHSFKQKRLIISLTFLIYTTSYNNRTLFLHRKKTGTAVLCGKSLESPGRQLPPVSKVTDKITYNINSLNGKRGCLVH